MKTEDHDITCPVCGSNNWKLFRWNVDPNGDPKDYIGGFRVACANGCYVDNVNIVHKTDTSFDVIQTAFKLIDHDRKGTHCLRNSGCLEKSTGK